MNNMERIWYQVSSGMHAGYENVNTFIYTLIIRVYSWYVDLVLEPPDHDSKNLSEVKNE